MRLTTARYYTPSGRSIQGLGIAPDVEVAESRTEQPHFGPEREADLNHALTNRAARRSKSAPPRTDLPPIAKDIPKQPPEGFADLRPDQAGDRLPAAAGAGGGARDAGRQARVALRLRAGAAGRRLRQAAGSPRCCGRSRISGAASWCWPLPARSRCRCWDRRPRRPRSRSTRPPPAVAPHPRGDGKIRTGATWTRESEPPKHEPQLAEAAKPEPAEPAPPPPPPGNRRSAPLARRSPPPDPALLEPAPDYPGATLPQIGPDGRQPRCRPMPPASTPPTPGRASRCCWPASACPSGHRRGDPCTCRRRFRSPFSPYAPHPERAARRRPGERPRDRWSRSRWSRRTIRSTTPATMRC